MKLEYYLKRKLKIVKSLNSNLMSKIFNLDSLSDYFVINIGIILKAFLFEKFFDIMYKNKKTKDCANIVISCDFLEACFTVGRMRITEVRLHVLLRTARESCYQDTTKVVVLCGTCIHGEHGRVRSRTLHVAHTSTRLRVYARAHSCTG